MPLPAPDAAANISEGRCAFCDDFRVKGEEISHTECVEIHLDICRRLPFNPALRSWWRSLDETNGRAFFCRERERLIWRELRQNAARSAASAAFGI